MNAYSRKHTPVPRPSEPGAIISKTERERAEKSLVTWTMTSEQLEEEYRRTGRPTMKLKDRRGFGGGAA